MVSPVNPKPSERGAVLAWWLRKTFIQERKLAQKARGIFLRQHRAAAKAFAATGSTLDATYAAYGHAGQMQVALEDSYARTGRVFGVPIIAAVERGKAAQGPTETKDAVNVFMTAMRAWGAFWAKEKLPGITKTTLAGIRGTIATGLQEGLGVEAIARKIKELGRGTISRLRARTIARTETHGAANYAQQRAAESTGIVFDREWLAVEDSRTRPDHADMDGTRIKKGENFKFPDGSAVEYPGDPSGSPAQVIACRCTTTQHAEY
jgi:SPP1 gp7 family putative phage head morphogenesis protein